MTAFENAIRDHLKADPLLVATITGVIVSNDDTGRLGISRDSTPDAYDTKARLEPSINVRSLDTFDTGVILGIDEVNTTVAQSVREVIEVWLVADGSTGLAVIDTLEAHILRLLSEQRVGGVRWHYLGTMNLPPQQELGRISQTHMDFQADYIRS